LLLEQEERLDEARRVWKQVARYDPEFRDVRERVEALAPEPEAAPPAQTPAPEGEPQRSSSGQKRRYVILEELGRGGMGVVYKAMDRVLDRVVALKVLPSDMRQNQQVVQTFFREAKAAASLTHPNIVVVFDAGEEDGVYYIAMEYIEGKTLKQMVKSNGPFPLPLLLLISGQVAKGLGYAHSHKIIHRDVKPSNLLWQSREKHVKITDFGLAKVIQEVVNFQTVVGGTPHYMSPEQILGEEVDPRSDIYSLGATLYELATGQVPFPKGDAGYHHIHTEPKDPVEIRGDLPRAYADVLLKSLEKEASQRYQTAEALFEALQSVRA
jgi:serine/threonine-protein kinase